jgi:hypothetical protein
VKLAIPDPMDLGFNVEPTRKCGPCQLCCKLLPVKELQKGANQRCAHQRHGKGCAVYRDKAVMPDSCQLWSCRWLLGLDTAELRRPDLARYVIDVIPDFVDVVNDDSTRTPVEIIQIWVDPKQRDAWKDPALRAFLERRAAEGKGALIRYSASDAITVFAPPLSARFGAPGGTWIVDSSGTVRPERTGRDRLDGVLAARRAVQPEMEGQA